MGKVPKNLLLDQEAIDRAELFTARHRVSVSQLVSDFLRGLPVDDDEPLPSSFSPTVRRLIGIARGERTRQDYRAHLEAKHLQ